VAVLLEERPLQHLRPLELVLGQVRCTGGQVPEDRVRLRQRAAGASLRFSFPDEIAPPMDGAMLAFEPPFLIELRWGPDVLRLELAPGDGGGTELTLLDILEAHGKAARDGAGWHVSLDWLEAELREEPIDRDSAPSHWRRVHPRYVESFGPAAAAIGPPEGLG
jgi:hypothetical protein